VVLLTPIALALAIGLPTTDPFPTTAAVLGATPFGAIWSVPGQIAAGRSGLAVLELVVALITLALMVVIWRASLLASSRYRGHASGTQRAAGQLGVFRWVPSTPRGAIAARSLVYWARDPRFTRQLLLVPLLPALLILLSALNGSTWMLAAAAPVVAGLLPLTLFAVVSYDGTAFALHLSSGIRGVDDRAGRASALLAFALPSVIVIAIVASTIVGSDRDLPAELGISVGLLLSGLAVSSVSSASLVVPVPRSGRNPFGAAPGSGMTSVVASYAVTAVTLGLAIPELALGIWSLVTHSVPLGWLALALGALWGAGSLVIGVHVGGGILDRTGPALLARMRRTGG
jgi:ABC-2 type transport system permease protein